MKPLTLEETKLKEEMKERCLAKGQYKDENAKAKFNMLCHLEDFEIQYWKLQKENEILKQNAENNDKVVDKVNWENQLLKKENQELKEKLDKYENPEDMTLFAMWCTEKVKDENQKLQTIANNCKQLKDNWNDLKKYAKEVISTDNELYGTDLLDKMQELERSDSNE